MKSYIVRVPSTNEAILEVDAKSPEEAKKILRKALKDADDCYWDISHPKIKWDNEMQGIGDSLNKADYTVEEL